MEVRVLFWAPFYPEKSGIINALALSAGALYTLQYAIRSSLDAHLPPATGNRDEKSIAYRSVVPDWLSYFSE
ncbi:hypothetical protein MES5069_200097 [Mesorhizobium escarrei]|uniref:Uncharacterized protein n=1 Tax=Mesorhizobium escarrei TaxID=666018 RepID=A0ABM9DPN5_9HYPH|nr:hypothetical protein MES5069_200097 [Mesorhizobium escarrei]